MVSIKRERELELDDYDAEDSRKCNVFVTRSYSQNNIELLKGGSHSYVATDQSKIYIFLKL